MKYRNRIPEPGTTSSGFADIKKKLIPTDRPYIFLTKMLWPGQENTKSYLKNNYLTLRSKVIMVCDTPPCGHAPTYQIKLTYLERQKFWSGQASLRSRRKNQTKTICLPSFEGET